MRAKRDLDCTRRLLQLLALSTMVAAMSNLRPGNLPRLAVFTRALVVATGAAGTLAAQGPRADSPFAKFAGDPAAIRRLETAAATLSAARQQLGPVHAKFRYLREFLVDEKVVAESFHGELWWSGDKVRYSAYRDDTGALQVGVFRDREKWWHAKIAAGQRFTIFNVRGAPADRTELFRNQNPFLTALDPVVFFWRGIGWCGGINGKETQGGFPERSSGRHRDAGSRQKRSDVVFRR